MKPHWSWFSNKESSQEITQGILPKLYIKYNQEPPPPKKSLYWRISTKWISTNGQRRLDKETLSLITYFPCSSCQGRRNTNIRNFWKGRHPNTKEGNTGRGMDTMQYHTLWNYRKRRDGNGLMQNIQVFANFWSQKFFFGVFALLSKTAIFSPPPLPSPILAISSGEVENSSFLYHSIYVLFESRSSYHLCEV